jgi:hypothetical protein
MQAMVITPVVTEDLVAVAQDTIKQTREDLLLTVGRRVTTEDLDIHQLVQVLEAVALGQQEQMLLVLVQVRRVEMAVPDYHLLLLVLLLQEEVVVEVELMALLGRARRLEREDLVVVGQERLVQVVELLVEQILVVVEVVVLKSVVLAVLEAQVW